MWPMLQDVISDCPLPLTRDKHAAKANLIKCLKNPCRPRFSLLRFMNYMTSSIFWRGIAAKLSASIRRM